MKRGGDVWIKIFPHKPVTKKPAEVRMGKGKGSVDHYEARVKPGHLLYEIKGVDAEIAKHAMELAAAKLPVRTRFLMRNTDVWSR
jgi:large subunit ribosomal protein L16